MCNINCITFGQRNLGSADVLGKRVVEIGSYDVNGSLRQYVTSLKPTEYVGVDIVRGYGVDVVCSAEKLRERFGDERFDVVISTEMIEHVRDWRKVISNMKNLCRPGGVVLITTRSFGFEYHGWPYDFWRFEVEDMKDIFSDFVLENVESDSLQPGVLVSARKPVCFAEKDLSSVELYSVITDRRERDIGNDSVSSFIESHAAQYGAKNEQTLKSRIRIWMRDLSWRVLR